MFDFESYRISDSPESKMPAIFKSADDHGYEIPPCACLFAGKPHAGKSIYLRYAVNRWKDYHEAFGIFPFIHEKPINAVCFALDRGESISGVECMDPFSKLGRLTCDVFSQLIESFYFSRLYGPNPVRVIFIDNLRALTSKLTDIPLSPQVSDQQAFIGEFLSKLAVKLGIYIFVLMHLSKSKDRVTDIQDAILGTNGIVGSYRGACYIVEKTNSYIDLQFDWRVKLIKRRVLFGDKQDELIPEDPAALFERLEEKSYAKFGGYERLRQLLSQFKDGPITVPATMLSMKITSTQKMWKMLKEAKEDGYLFKDGPRSSYQLTDKGRKVVELEETAGAIDSLIVPSDRELFYRFAKEIFGKDSSAIHSVKFLTMSTYSKWKEWREKNVNPGIADS